jgi:hypothetical protein
VWAKDFLPGLGDEGILSNFIPLITLIPALQRPEAPVLVEHAAVVNEYGTNKRMGARTAKWRAQAAFTPVGEDVLWRNRRL